MANAILFFLPSSVSSVLEWSVKATETHRVELAKHEEKLNEAFCCFERGLELDPNHVELLMNVRHCYGAGEGVAQDEVKAFALLRKCAEMGDFRAQTTLGVWLLWRVERRL